MGSFFSIKNINIRKTIINILKIPLYMYNQIHGDLITDKKSSKLDTRSPNLL